MSAAWEKVSEAFVKRLASELGADFTTSRLTDRLLEYRFKPPTEDASEVRLVVSAYEVILSAGKGTRFELEPLPGSEVQAARLARAVGSGGLTEWIWTHRVRFQLRLEDGELVEGGLRSGLMPWRGKPRKVEYRAYR